SINKKLLSLLAHHPIKLIHPIHNQKWIIRKETNGEKISQRKSPKKGRVEEIFREIVRAHKPFTYPNLELCVAIVNINEIWTNDGEGSWRRKFWSITDQTLISVEKTISFKSPSDYINLIPKRLLPKFTNSDLAVTLKIPDHLARKMTYSLRKMNLLEVVEIKGNTHIHSIRET
ncbi:hypothetical protein ACFLYP_04290, partial [Chloroflexota bacterium]